jgi:phosphate-selective porin OprO/OprP
MNNVKLLPGVSLLLLLYLTAVPLRAENSSGPQKTEDAASTQKKKGGASAQKKKGGSKTKKKGEAKNAKKSTGDAPESGPQDEKDSSGVKFKMNSYPSLRFGQALRMDFHVKAQGDFRGLWPERAIDGGVFELHRARIGVEGRFLKHFEYEVEREFRDAFRQLYEDVDVVGRTKNPWRDVYVNFRYFRNFQIKTGKFKLPFGMDQLQGPTKLDFINRSRIGDLLAPARDKGIMAHGRFFERGLNYQAGYFRQDGENARTKDNAHTGEHVFAGRVTATPLRLFPVPAVTKNLELGAALVTSHVGEGPKGLRGRTINQETFFHHINVNGRRVRMGTEMNWRPGPFSLQGEFMHVQEERKGQGLLEEDLSDLIARGWYLSGTWVVTGEKKSEGVEPRKEFLRGWGIGAIELAARYEQLRFSSSEHPGKPSRAPRAANILGNSDRVWTFGINWYLNRWVKIQGNAIREKIEDTQRSPISGRERFWSGQCRLQFVM